MSTSLTSLPATAERQMIDLDPVEVFVVASLRAWAAPHLRPGEPHPDWRDLMRRVGICAQGAAGFETLMSVVGAHAQRLLELRCCRCPSLGGDEAAMLRLIAALQRADTLGALDVLTDWLPPGCIAPALRGAHRFAAHTIAVGLQLPPPAAAPRPAAAVLH